MNWTKKVKHGLVLTSLFFFSSLYVFGVPVEAQAKVPLVESKAPHLLHQRPLFLTKICSFHTGKRPVVCAFEQGVATFNGAADNHTIEVTVEGETFALQVGYDQASDFDIYIDKQKTIRWLNLPNGQKRLVSFH